MIEVKNLNKTYDRGRRGDHRVLKDVSFTLPQTGFVCILGPSGCGKTSLLNAIGGLDQFDNGTLTTGDTTVNRYGTAVYEAQRNRNFGYIFQNYYLLEDHSVAYNVYIGLHSLELSHAEKLKRVRVALEAVDMGRYIRRKVRDLSGGQQQRIAIARALARRPRVIFADEPTGNLDETNTLNICALLRKASRESLVIMVTHEEHIANFFADRIIRLDQGVIASDSENWDRNNLHLESDKEIYTGDYEEAVIDKSHMKLRLLHTPDAPTVELTVVASRDRIILKLSDSRAVMLSQTGESPRIIEGNRPVITLESVDQESTSRSALFAEPPAPQCRAGKGIRLGMMARESLQLMQGKGLKRMGMRLFLIMLSVLTLLTIADFITISKVDPQDFITTDSHMLYLKVVQGGKMPEGEPPIGHYTWYSYNLRQYVDHIENSGLDFDYIPLFSNQPKYTISLYYQMYDARQRMPAFSYVCANRLTEDQLLCGRLPVSSEEVVIDRILIDAILAKDGIIQNAVTDYTSFLGETLDYGNRGLNPVVVGVSDSGERSIYAYQSALFTFGNRGYLAITAEELQQRFPNMYDTIEMQTALDEPPKVYNFSDLPDDGCIMNISGAGEIWKHRMGQLYGSSPNHLHSKAWIENEDLAAHIIVTEACLQNMIKNNYDGNIHIWCTDKEAMKEYLSHASQLEQDGYITVSVTDPYAVKYAMYEEAASIRADARTIVTATILLLSIVMLYLLQRTQVNERLDLIAVYRLLGIPGRKLYGIFLMEGIISSLGTVVPSVAATWAAIALSAKVPELESTLELPWQAAVIAGGCIVVYYLLVTILPLARLLRLPPAQLAAKYDM